MKLLLDTQAFIWMTHDPLLLPAGVRDALIHPDNSIYLSIVSPLEMQIKVNLKKLALSKSVRELVQFERDRGAVELLSISLEHVDALTKLPDHHRDPFDRLLVAQAIVEGLTIVTSDQTLPRYAAPVLWS